MRKRHVIITVIAIATMVFASGCTKNKADDAVDSGNIDYAAMQKNEAEQENAKTSDNTGKEELSDIRSVNERDENVFEMIEETEGESENTDELNPFLDNAGYYKIDTSQLKIFDMNDLLKEYLFLEPDYIVGDIPDIEKYKVDRVTSVSDEEVEKYILDAIGSDDTTLNMKDEEVAKLTGQKYLNLSSLKKAIKDRLIEKANIENGFNALSNYISDFSMTYERLDIPDEYIDYERDLLRNDKNLFSYLSGKPLALVEKQWDDKEWVENGIIYYLRTEVIKRAVSSYILKNAGIELNDDLIADGFTKYVILYNYPSASYIDETFEDDMDYQKFITANDLMYIEAAMQFVKD